MSPASPATRPSPAAPSGTVHRAVPCRGPEHQAATLRSPLERALERGDHAVAVVDDRCRAELDRELGPDAGVEFRRPEQMHSAPAFTVATRWARTARAAARGGGGRRLMAAAQQFDLPHTDAAYWTRLDVALGRVLHGLPVTMLCCFDDAPGARDAAGTMHDTLLVDGEDVASSTRRGDRDLLAEHPQPPPEALGPPLLDTDVDLAGLARMRRLVRREAVLSGLGPFRASDLVLALNEIVTNGAEHGSGLPRLRLWRTPDELVGEVTDTVRTRLPFPGMIAPPAAGTRGRGLWLASELTDVLQVWTADDDPDCPDGTVVRVRMSPP
jgi:anti-sigma regulatory factor (Ser/Thr protein kinase)